MCCRYMRTRSTSSRRDAVAGVRLVFVLAVDLDDRNPESPGAQTLRAPRRRAGAGLDLVRIARPRRRARRPPGRILGAVAPVEHLRLAGGIGPFDERLPRPGPPRTGWPTGRGLLGHVHGRLQGRCLLAGPVEKASPAVEEVTDECLSPVSSSTRYRTCVFEDVLVRWSFRSGKHTTSWTSASVTRFQRRVPSTRRPSSSDPSSCRQFRADSRC